MISRSGWRALRGAALALCLGGVATAQWTDGFESYADGSVLDGQGDWHGWDGVNTNNAWIASQFASSGSQSVMLLSGADSLHEFDGYDSGHWTLRADLYIPTSFVGTVYFLAFNHYVDGGPYQWSVQVAFNGDSNELEVNLGSGTPTQVPLVRGQWAEIRCDINLDTDNVDISYDGALLGSYPWSAGPYGGAAYGLLKVAAVDLFSPTKSVPIPTEVYFDELALIPYQGFVGTAYCFGDGTSAGCPCGNSGAADEGCGHGGGVGAKLETFGSPTISADDVVFNGSQLPAGQPSLLFAGMNAVQAGNGAVFGDGLRCAGGGVVRLGVRTADANGDATWGPGLGAGGGWLAGDTRRFQTWYRDPSGSPCGAGFNLSHGVEIDFIL
jgi:hypothetical protein